MRAVDEWVRVDSAGPVTTLVAEPNDGTLYEVLIVGSGFGLPVLAAGCCLVVVVKPHVAVAPLRVDLASVLDESYVHEKLGRQAPDGPTRPSWTSRVLTLMLAHHLGRPAGVDERWLASCDL
jgi:hypothetical protein